MAIVQSNVFVCNGCGHRVPSEADDPDTPMEGFTGTVNVPSGGGEFTTESWFAHRVQCLRAAVERVLGGLLPPDPEPGTRGRRRAAQATPETNGVADGHAEDAAELATSTP